MADAPAAEKCARCGYGNYYVIGEDDQSELLRCLSCEHTQSRVKEGFQVAAPGEPITPVEEGA
jgi:hypothetical protein